MCIQSEEKKEGGESYERKRIAKEVHCAKYRSKARLSRAYYFREKLALARTDVRQSIRVCRRASAIIALRELVRAEAFTRDIRMLDALGRGIIRKRSDADTTRRESLESDAIAKSRRKKISISVKLRELG